MPLNRMPSVFKCAWQRPLPTSSGTEQLTAHPQNRTSTEHTNPAGLEASHSISSIAAFRHEKYKFLLAAGLPAATFPLAQHPVKSIQEEDFTNAVSLRTG